MHISFDWHETTMRRDPDNISGGGRKIILDALVFAKVIPDDGPKYVAGFTDRFIYSPTRQPGVALIIESAHDRKDPAQ